MIKSVVVIKAQFQTGWLGENTKAQPECYDQDIPVQNFTFRMF